MTDYSLKLFFDSVKRLCFDDGAAASDAGKILAGDEGEKIIEEAITLSKNHNMEGLFLQGLTKCVPGLSGRFKWKILEAVAKNAGKKEAIDELIKKFEEENINLLVFKGYTLRKLYPVPELRSFGDVDTLIAKEKLSKAEEIAIAQGYRILEKGEDVTALGKGKAVIELHAKIMSEYDYGVGKKALKLTENPMEYAVKAENNSYEFRDGYHLFFIMLHIAKHIYHAGCGIRMILDFALLSGKINASEAGIYKTLAVKSEMCRFSDNLLSLSKLFFGKTNEGLYFDKENNCRESSVKELGDFVIFGGTFGMANDNFYIAQIRKNNSSKREEETSENNAKSSRWNAIFPKKEVIMRRYSWCKKCKLLLPLGYIVRALQVLFSKERRKKGRERLEKLNGKNAETAKNQQIMFEKIGL